MSEALSRRHVIAGLGAAGSALFAASAAAQPVPAGNGVTGFPGPLGDGQRFEASALVDLARAMARRPAQAVATDLPDGLGQISLDALAGIRMRPASHLFAGENRGFTIEPLHRGAIYSYPVALFTVEDGVIRRVAFDKARFDYGRVPVPQSNADLGFSGFRIAISGERAQDVAIFQGATFYRAIARGQTFGAMARALVLRPGETRGEEVPMFRAFWIERPGPAATAITLHGLIESESATAAVRMTLRPGDVTLNDVEMTLFARNVLDNVGFGGMTGTYLFAPQRRRIFDDVRPAVHEVAGLQMRTGVDEWVYRPLNNPEQLQVSSFLDTNPRGFGLVQRERDYLAYQDDDQRYEARPSIWIEPLGDWGAGSVQLLEVPTESDLNDNIIAHWRPRQPLPAGSETVVTYRQSWCWQPPETPPVAIARSTRQGRGSQGRRRRFTVDFVGDALADAALAHAARAVLSATPGALHHVRVLPYPDRRTIRIAFELDPGAENASELRLVLEANGRPISETWLNRWTP